MTQIDGTMVSITTLYNVLGVFIDSMPNGNSYEVIMREILRSFGLTMYDYSKKCRYARQSNETLS